MDGIEPTNPPRGCIHDGTQVRGTLNFQNNMRTALVIKDGQIHRWSAMKPGVLGPGVPTPFSMMYARGPSADGRSVISLSEGRVFDIGAWPPRPIASRWLIRVAIFTSSDPCPREKVERRCTRDARFVATSA